jgi:hypothetical protein
VRVKIAVSIAWCIHEACIETLDFQGTGNAAAQLRQRIPDHPLLLDVQVVKCANVAAGSYYQVTGCEGIRMRYSDHEVVRHPGIVWDNRTIHALGQTNTIAQGIKSISSPRTGGY